MIKGVSDPISTIKKELKMVLAKNYIDQNVK